MSQKIVTFILVIVAAIGGFFGFYSVKQVNDIQEQTFGAFNPAAGDTYRLKSSVGTTDTSITLSSFKEPVSGLKITMSSLATDIAYGTLDPQSTTRKELISFTGVTQNADGSATLTGVSRGLSFLSPFTASSTLRKAHPGQSIFILSDSPQLFNEYAVKQNAESITGIWTYASTSPALYDGTFAVSTTSRQIPYAGWINLNFGDLFNGNTWSGTQTFEDVFSLNTGTIASTTIANGFYTGASTQNNHLVNKAYVDGVAIAGASDADETTKGIVEEATQAEVNAGTGTGGTGAQLFIPPDKLQGGVFSYIDFYTGSVYSGINTAQFGINVTADDTIVIWAFSRENSACSAGAGNELILNLQIKQSTFAATTTVETAEQSTDGGDGCSITIPYFFTATTTETINVAAVNGNVAAGDKTALYIQHFKE